MTIMTYEMGEAIRSGAPLMILTEIEHPSGMGRFWSGVGSLEYKSFPVVLLLHFDGDFSDEKENIVTAVGDAQIDSDEFKFGSGALRLDGVGDYLVIGDSPSFSLGASDFTIDTQFKCEAPLGSYKYLAGQVDAAGMANANSAWMIRRDTTTGAMAAYVAQGTTVTEIMGTTVFSDVDNTGLHHVGFTRKDNVLRMFIDGVQEGPDTPFTGSVNNSNAPLGIGSLGGYVTDPWKGLIDEFRMIIGGAVWTESFTAPMSPWPTSLLWRGAGVLGMITPIQHTTQLGVQEINFTLVGVDAEVLAKLPDDVRNKPGRVFLACLDDRGRVVADPIQIVDAELDYQSQKIGEEGSNIIQLTARTGFFNLDRSVNDVWSSEDQQSRFPGDTGLDLISKLQNQTLVWGPT